MVSAKKILDEVDFEIPDKEETGEDENIEECDVIVPDTQTQIIPETQNSQNTQLVPETQDVIVIDG